MSSVTEPLLKLVRPLVLFALPRMPPCKKFSCRMTPVSEVNWNSGVVRPADARIPGNRYPGKKKLNTVGEFNGVCESADELPVSVVFMLHVFHPSVAFPERFIGGATSGKIVGLLTV